MMHEVNDALLDLSAESIDTSLRLLTDNEILDDVPIVGNFLKLMRTGASVRDYLFLRKISAFFGGVDSSTTKEEKEKFAKDFEKDRRKREKLYEYIFLFIDRIDDISKADIASKIFASFVRQKIRLEDLKSLCHTVNQVSVDDLSIISEHLFLNHYHLSGGFVPGQSLCPSRSYKLDSFVSVGLVSWSLKSEMKTVHSGHPMSFVTYEIDYEYTELGKLYCFIFEGLDDFFDRISPELKQYPANYNKNYFFLEYQDRDRVQELIERLRVKWKLPPMESD